MATKMENRVGVNFAIFRSNPWRQFIVHLEICCKDTNIHENVENKISDFWLKMSDPVTYSFEYTALPKDHLAGVSSITFLITACKQTQKPV